MSLCTVPEGDQKPAADLTAGALKGDPGRLIEFHTEVARFCIREGLQQYLPMAVGLVRERFHLIEEPKVEVECDPEADGEWVAINVVLRHDPEDFARLYDRYTLDVLAAVPWPQCDKIRLAYVLR